MRSLPVIVYNCLPLVGLVTANFSQAGLGEDRVSNTIDNTVDTHSQVPGECIVDSDWSGSGFIFPVAVGGYRTLWGLATENADVWMPLVAWMSGSGESTAANKKANDIHSLFDVIGLLLLVLFWLMSIVIFGLLLPFVMVILMMVWTCVFLVVLLLVIPFRILAGPAITCLNAFRHVAEPVLMCVQIPGSGLRVALTFPNLILACVWVFLETARMFRVVPHRPVRLSSLLQWSCAIQMYWFSMAALTARFAGHMSLFTWTLYAAVAASIKLIYARLPEWLSVGLFLTYVTFDFILDCSAIVFSLFVAVWDSDAIIELYIYIPLISTIGCLRFWVQYPGAVWEYLFGTDAATGTRNTTYHSPPWTELQVGVQVFRTGAFGFGFLSHHGVYVGQNDFLHYYIDVPNLKSIELLSIDDENCISGALVEEWNRKNPKEQIEQNFDRVIRVNGCEGKPARRELRTSIVLNITLQRRYIDIDQDGNDIVTLAKYSVTLNRFDILALFGLQACLDLSFRDWTVPRVTGDWPWPDSIEKPVVGDLVVGIEELADTTLRVTLRRPVIVHREQDRVIEMSGTPGNVSIMGISWDDFRNGLNQSGSISSAGGLLPEFQARCFVRRYEGTTAECMNRAVRRALASEYKKVSYRMNCNCETFAVWCGTPDDDDGDMIGFEGSSPGSSPQGEGLCLTVLTFLTGMVAASCWCWRDTWRRACSVVAVVIMARLIYSKSAAVTSHRLVRSFEDLMLVLRTVDTESDTEPLLYGGM